MFPNDHLHQTAVYWQKSGSDGYRSLFTDAVEIDVRWVVKNESFLDRDGKEKVSKAQVRVAQDIGVGDYLLLGVLTDLDSADLTNPIGVEGASEVRAFTNVPTISGKDFSRKAWL